MEERKFYVNSRYEQRNWVDKKPRYSTYGPFDDEDEAHEIMEELHSNEELVWDNKKNEWFREHTFSVSTTAAAKAEEYN